MGWLERNSGAIQSLGAIVTAIVAVLALVGVKMQIDASYLVQREQSAKEIYRELLNITIANPDYAAPNYCALKQSPKLASYEAYVDYVLYTAEQVIDMDSDWAAVMDEHLQSHADYLCDTDVTADESTGVAALMSAFKAKHCQAASAC